MTAPQPETYDQGNVFARILRDEIPAHKVYEDENTLAFMDVMPQVPGHTLVIPKFPAVTLSELPADLAAALIQSVQKIEKAVKKAFGTGGAVIMQLNGPSAGQTVPHVHFHVLPGSVSDLRKPHATTLASPDELKANAEKIRQVLADGL